MPATRATIALSIVALSHSLAGTSFAGEQPYKVKLSDIAIPAGASLGEIRRTIQPFPNWTLICDENLKAHTKVCNVTQNFIDASGSTAFSWSLAATEAGKPVFVLRAPASLGPDGTISVKPASGKPLAAAVQACDSQTCIATLPLGRALSDDIAHGEPVKISYEVDSHHTGDLDATDVVTLSAPLNGLAKALAAIE